MGSADAAARSMTQIAGAPRPRRRRTSPRPIASARIACAKASCSRTPRPARRGDDSSGGTAAAQRAPALLRLHGARKRELARRCDDGAHHRGTSAQRADITRRHLHDARALDRRPADLGQGGRLGLGPLRRMLRRDHAAARCCDGARRRCGRAACRTARSSTCATLRAFRRLAACRPDEARREDDEASHR